MKVGVFLHGTAIMHAAAAAVGRGERIRGVVLPEFSGLAGLPDDPAELLTRGGTATSLPGNRRATAEAPT